MTCLPLFCFKSYLSALLFTLLKWVSFLFAGFKIFFLCYLLAALYDVSWYCYFIFNLAVIHRASWIAQMACSFSSVLGKDQSVFFLILLFFYLFSFFGIIYRYARLFHHVLHMSSFPFLFSFLLASTTYFVCVSYIL